MAVWKIKQTFIINPMISEKWSPKWDVPGKRSKYGLCPPNCPSGGTPYPLLTACQFSPSFTSRLWSMVRSNLPCRSTLLQQVRPQTYFFKEPFFLSDTYLAFRIVCRDCYYYLFYPVDCLHVYTELLSLSTYRSVVLFTLWTFIVLYILYGCLVTGTISHI